MNKRQKEVIQYQLDSEKEVLEQLQKQYQRALNDIDRKIRILESDELTQSRVYRLEYQKALKMQVAGILEKLHSDEYTTIQQFLSHSYTDAFVGTVYDMFGQGVPFIMPIDNNAAVKAVLTDSKISEGLYKALGVDTKKLKNSISAEITRGIATGMPHSEIARNIASAAKAPLSRAKTIVRTESHRIAQASTYDAQKAAKAKGADVVKQWDSTLDGNTRDSHRRLDGQIKELDEPFKLGNKEAMYPGDFNDPAEDCNCRCELLQRARVALDEEELQTLKERAEYFGLDKTDDFEDFRNKYIEITSNPRYNILQKLDYSGKVTPEIETSLEQSLSRIPTRHRDVAETKISGIEVTDSDFGSSYVRSTGLIKISENAGADDIIHEYAHALAEALGSYSDPKFRKIMLNGLENITPLDVIYDETSFKEPIYRVECDKFVSKYQGRLYEEVGIFSGAGVSFDGMLDYISEGYEEYIRNPTNLKEHDPELFDYFEGIT